MVIEDCNELGRNFGRSRRHVLKRLPSDRRPWLHTTSLSLSHSLILCARCNPLSKPPEI